MDVADRAGAGQGGSARDEVLVAPADGVTTVEEMDLVGGAPALDFVNTGSGRSEPPFKEKLGGYGDLVTWARRLDLVGPETERKLRRAAEADPAGAERVLTRGRELREAIYRAFSATRGDAAPPAEALAIIGEHAARASSHRRLVPTEDGCEWDWAEADADVLERPLWPVALSAAELATSSDQLARVKECGSDNCNWLFLDMSRNRSRRWCDMKDCGNRAKARRFRARHQ